MNAKKCKELRRQAQLMTVGEPLVKYEPRGYFPGSPSRPACQLPIVMAHCTRYVYKQLKKAA